MTEPYDRYQLEDARALEIAKYERAYKDPDYRMGAPRQRELTDYLNTVPEMERGSYLDVGTGMGEALRIAAAACFDVVHGCEVIPFLCGGAIHQIQGVHALPYPDERYDVVTCLDVMEHLLEADAVAGIREMIRVARCRVLLVIAWFPHVVDGDVMHITCHELPWWEFLVRQQVPDGTTVRRLKGRRDRCGMLEIDLTTQIAPG